MPAPACRTEQSTNNLDSRAMEKLVTGAMGSLVSKLGKLLMDEYKLQTGMKDQVEYLR